MAHPGRALRGLLAAALLAPSALAGCGGEDLPPDAVARVGDSLITQADFNRAAKDKEVPGMAPGTVAATVYDPPDFSACVREKKRGKPESTREEDLEEECKSEFETLRPQVMETLIGNAWIRQEASRRGIAISDAELRRYRAQVARAVRGSGFKPEQDAAAIRLQMLEDELAKVVSKRIPDVTSGEVGAYYARNRKRFVRPERRDVDLVLTRTEARADEAAAALRRGAGWSAVARRYSIDPQSRARGGRLAGVERGDHERPLDAALFAATEGELGGPLKTQFGWYVFEVSEVHEPAQRSLSEARKEIRRRLEDQHERRVFRAFNDRFDDRWEPQTVCAEDFTVGDCGNG